MIRRIAALLVLAFALTACASSGGSRGYHPDQQKQTWHQLLEN